ncbi:MAG: BadF/BadG/BcrA/BcrD ATPase family protein, partial [Dehalococcoidia bacterium]|nr:BadF/BadG/BcrA/BcrD ATPase family protein [Dehalococcoidia bacterium]
MKYFLGLDIGSVNAKLALIDESGNTVHKGIEKISSSPLSAVNSLVAGLSNSYDLNDIVSAGVSGCGDTIIPEELSWSVFTSPFAIAAGVLHYHPEAKTIIQIGGQTSMVISLDDGLNKPWRVSSNPLCAAGTGKFIEQQAYRLGISIDEFSRLGMEYEGAAPRIAARCSVFAKSDLIHLQQKGVPLPAMIKGLSDSIARMVVSLHKGLLAEPVYFIGGVAGNASVKQALEEAISAGPGRKMGIIVPEDYLFLEAVGCALLSKTSGRESRVVSLTESGGRKEHLVLPGLSKNEGGNTWYQKPVDTPFTGYLGVDVGSTSTKAVIMDEAGLTVVAKYYTMTA